MFPICLCRSRSRADWRSDIRVATKGSRSENLGECNVKRGDDEECSAYLLVVARYFAPPH